MRTVHLLCLTALSALVFTACNESSPSTAQTDLGGPYSITEFTSNSAYNSWYQTGFDAYPPAESQASFNTAVAQIQSAMNAGEASYKMVMVTKPNCGCQHTQIEMPRVMKTLISAGFDPNDVEIYITDTRLAGIDDVKAEYNIVSSEQVPAFILVKDDVEQGRIVQEPDVSIEADLAAMF